MIVNTFKEDLAIGKLGEEKVLQKIRKKYPCSVIIPGYFKGYDIWVPEIHKSIEVKYQKKNDRYNTFVVEIEANGEPSALSTTIADIWVFYDGDHYTWTTPKQIRECIDTHKLQLRYFKQDFGKKKAYFVPKQLLA